MRFEISSQCRSLLLSPRNIKACCQSNQPQTSLKPTSNSFKPATNRPTIEADGFLPLNGYGEKISDVLNLQNLQDLREVESMLEENLERWKENFKAQAQAEGKIEGRIEGKIEGKIEGRIEGKIEGKIEAARESLLKILKFRFGQLPDNFISAISNMSDYALLSDLQTSALTKSSLQDFMNFLPRDIAKC